MFLDTGFLVDDEIQLCLQKTVDGNIEKLAKKHNMDFLIITCNPDNYASRRTCEYAGCHLVEIAALPEDNDMRLENGETEKCIYRIEMR